MGELARQPGGPKLAETPLELLTPRTNEFEIALRKWGWPIFGGAVGFFTAVLRNALAFRPVWAGIHTHILLTGGTAFVVTYIRDVKTAARAHDEEMYRDYVSLHPEDYPPFERKRYRDVYQPFRPFR